MAGRPAAVRGGGLSGAHIGLIVFAFVSVAALGGFIFQLTKVKGAEDAAAQKEGRLAHFGQPSGAVGSYYDNEATNRKTTVFAVVAEEQSKIAKLVAGQEQAVAASLEEEAANLLGPIAASKPGVVNANDTLFTAIRKLDAGLTETLAANGTLSAKLDTKTQDVESLTQQLKASRDRFDEQVAQTKGDYEQAAADFNRKLGEKEAQLTGLQSTLEVREQELQQFRRERDQERRELNLEIGRQERMITKLQEQIKDLKGSFDAEAILKKADGRIARAIPGSEIVYVNLGANDNIKTGMGFEVYSQTGSVGATLRGKASLEVVTLMDNTAECRVTRTTPGQPIIEGDIVVNIAYEQSRKPKFVIRGQFDLDFDGQIDIDGAQDIQGIIGRWGGQVVPELDESVDYVVIGLAPQVPSLSPGASDVVRDQEERRLLELSEFRQIIDEARSMYIPVITQNQFLFLTGYVGSTDVRTR